MKTTITLLAVAALACAHADAATEFLTFNDRAAFLAALDTTLIDDDLQSYAGGGDIDFENNSVNTLSPGNPLNGFDFSHSGDEVTTQFVNGSNTNNSNTGNPGVDIQLLLDFAGVTGAFGANSNQADTGTITVETAGVNAFGFDAFGFNDQGNAFLQDPQALGLEPGVITKVSDSLGNMQEFTVQPTDAFFGVIAVTPGATIDDILFSAAPTFASSGAEFISLDNFVGGSSSIPEPATAGLMILGLTAAGFVHRRV